VNQPTPAIVAQSAVRRLPRLYLLLLCAAYVLPGFLGRSPWKAQDIEAFGYMLQLAQPGLGDALHWFKPMLLGTPDGQLALLPYWLGAWSIQWAPAGWEALFARLPFMGMLVMTLASTWYAVHALTRHPGAQPVSFAFGGEAKPTDYARAMADGGLLALLACLGLARLSHETSPALSQLCFAALLFFGLASWTRHRHRSAAAVAVGMLGLTLSGAPVLALLLGLGGGMVCALGQPDPAQRRIRMFDLGLLALMGLLCLTTAGALDLWRWRVVPHNLMDVHKLAKLMVWFTWPAWPLAIWSLWRWRGQLAQFWRYPHLGLPVWFVIVTVGATWFTGLSDKAMLTSLPAVATLAALALPTLKRSWGALIDWFTLAFFSLCGLAIWVVWLAMQTGVPAKTAANVTRMAPEFVPELSLGALTLAVLATLSWATLVRWRTGYHRAVIWKSLVLPAGGAVLCWLLLTTLWMPLLNYALSYTPLMDKVTQVTGRGACIQYAGISKAQGTALLHHAQARLQSMQSPHADCPWLVVDRANLSLLSAKVQSLGWVEQSTIKRPTDKFETLVIFRAASSVPTAADTAAR
jgi:hypothetical protein